jgi:hypothetical protein
VCLEESEENGGKTEPIVKDLSDKRTFRRVLSQGENSSNFFLSKRTFCWALVAHACNTSYLGGRDQED